MLADAVKHAKAIRAVSAGGARPIAGFIVITNRPLGNISGLPEYLNNLDRKRPPDELMCPTCLGTTPSAKDPAPSQSTTIVEWCKGLTGVNELEAVIAADLLVNLRFFRLSIPQCTAKFERIMQSLGLNSSEAFQVGNQLNGQFLTQVDDAASGILALKTCIFDSETSFHHFTWLGIANEIHSLPDNVAGMWVSPGYY